MHVATNISLHLALKYARIFVLGHYLFNEAHSRPRAMLLENCSLLGTNNVCGKIYPCIFSRQMDAIVYTFTSLYFSLTATIIQNKVHLIIWLFEMLHAQSHFCPLRNWFFTVKSSCKGIRF